MGRIQADNQSVKTVEETEFDYIIPEKSPEGMEKNIKIWGCYSNLKKWFRSDIRECVELLDVLLYGIIRIMKDIPFQKFSAAPFFKDELVMRIHPAPESFPAIP